MPRKRRPPPPGTTPENYAKAVEDQRSMARKAAEKLEVGEQLHEHERRMAAGVLRAWADSILSTPPPPPPRRGAPPKIDHEDVSTRYIRLRLSGASHSAAIAKVLEEYSLEHNSFVDEGTIRNIINGDHLCRLVR